MYIYQHDYALYLFTHAHTHIIYIYIYTSTFRYWYMKYIRYTDYSMYSKHYTPWIQTQCPKPDQVVFVAVTLAGLQDKGREHLWKPWWLPPKNQRCRWKIGDSSIDRGFNGKMNIFYKWNLQLLCLITREYPQYHPISGFPANCSFNSGRGSWGYHDWPRYAKIILARPSLWFLVDSKWNPLKNDLGKNMAGVPPQIFFRAFNIECKTV